MATPNSINISGMMMNMLSSGFDTIDCIGELIDNSIGANAKNIHIHLLDNLVIFVDDGEGMNKDELNKCYCLHERKDASDTRVGYFGIGSKHAKIHFTQHKFANTTISKKKDTDLMEIEADWKEAVEKGNYFPQAHKISSDSKEIWEKYSISKKHGTIDVIPCDKKINIEFNESVDEIINKLSITYYEYLIKNNILFFVKGKEYKLKSTDPISWAKATNENKQELVIEIWKNKSTNNIYSFYKDKNKMCYLNTYEKTPKFKLDYNYPLENCENINTITIKSVYIDSWKDTLDEGHQSGGIYLKRSGKILDHFKCSIKNSGDYHYRNYVTIARHLIIFNSTLDKEFQVQINKSHIKESDINKNIYETINYIAEKFSNKLFNIFNKKRKEEQRKLEEEQRKKEEEKRKLEEAKRKKEVELLPPKPVITYDIKLTIVDNKLEISNNSINIMKIQNVYVKELYEEYLNKLTAEQYIAFIKEQKILMGKYGLQ